MRDSDSEQLAVCIATQQWGFSAVVLQAGASAAHSFTLLSSAQGREPRPRIRQLAGNDAEADQRNFGSPTSLAGAGSCLAVGTASGVIACSLSTQLEDGSLDDWTELRIKGRRLSLFRCSQKAAL